MNQAQKELQTAFNKIKNPFDIAKLSAKCIETVTENQTSDAPKEVSLYTFLGRHPLPKRNPNFDYSGCVALVSQLPKENLRILEKYDREYALLCMDHSDANEELEEASTPEEKKGALSDIKSIEDKMIEIDNKIISLVKDVEFDIHAEENPSSEKVVNLQLKEISIPTINRSLEPICKKLWSLFPKKYSENVFISGSSALNSFLGIHILRGSDIDVFFTGMTAKQIAEFVTLFEKNIQKECKTGRMLVSHTKHCLTYSLPLIDDEEYSIFREVPVQLVLRAYKRPEDISIGFDIAACGVLAQYNEDAFCGEEIEYKLTMITILSIVYGQLVDPTKSSRNYGQRLYKYLNRGLSLIFPGICLDDLMDGKDLLLLGSTFNEYRQSKEIRGDYDEKDPKMITAEKIALNTSKIDITFTRKICSSRPKEPCVWSIERGLDKIHRFNATEFKMLIDRLSTILCIDSTKYSRFEINAIKYNVFKDILFKYERFNRSELVFSELKEQFRKIYDCFIEKRDKWAKDVSKMTIDEFVLIDNPGTQQFTSSVNYRPAMTLEAFLDCLSSISHPLLVNFYKYGSSGAKRSINTGHEAIAHIFDNAKRKNHDDVEELDLNGLSIASKRVKEE